jgi:4-amino-4-deoxychorismate lyase
MKLVESVRLYNGKFDNLFFHQQRMNNSRKELFGCTYENNLTTYLQKTIIEKDMMKSGLFKCRVIYAEQIETTEILPYLLPLVKTLKLEFDDDIDYRFKYLDRSRLEKLYSQKGTCDDIIIVKNGLITDSSTANLLFFNGKNWLTPSKPLLKGTRRAQLLADEIIKTADFRISDLKHFLKVRLINAMIRFEDEIDIPIAKVIY